MLRAAGLAVLLATTALAPAALAQTRPGAAAAQVPPIVYKTRTLPNGL